MRVLALIFSLMVSSYLMCQQNNWVKKASYGGWKRERAVGFGVAGKGYVCSGQDTANLVTNDLWEYDPASNSWSQRANMPGVGRRNAVAFSIGNIGYVGTGMSAASSSMGTELSDMWAYNPATNSWSAIAPYPGGWGNGVYFATAFTLDGKGYICAGKVGPSNYITDLWEYKPLTDQWTQRAPFPGGDRYQLTSFTVNGRAYVGLGTDENAYTNDIYEYLPATNQWIQKSNFPGAERSSCSAFSLYDKGYICLGGDGGYLDDLWEYNAADDYWTLRANYPSDPRRNAFSFVINNRAYVGGGKSYNGLKRSMYEYTPIEPVGVNELDLDFSVYPNPCINHINISFNARIASVEVYSMSGRMVMQSSGEINRLDLNELASGCYTLHVYNSDGKKAYQRIIKK